MTHSLFTLRHNIVVENDVSLAEEEIRAIARVHDGVISRLASLATVKAWLSARVSDADGLVYRFITKTPKRKGIMAFAMEGITPAVFQSIIRRAAFLQEAVLVGPSPHLDRGFSLPQLTRTIRLAGGELLTIGVPLATILEYSAPLVFQRERVGSISVALTALLEFLLDGSPPPSALTSHLQRAIRAKKTTLYLSHELHLYKGKFFPRLVHGLINRFAPPKSDGVVCDPFAGSGTALLEASLLGYRSVGLDVDPTAVLISRHKTSLANVNYQELLDVCTGIQRVLGEGQPNLFAVGNDYDAIPAPGDRVAVPEPMRSRLKKRGTEEGDDLLGEIEGDSAVARRLISQVPLHLRSLFRVCLSHALTKKIRLRFVGIGNGRFTFDVAKARVLDLFLRKTHHMLAIAEVFDWARRLGLRLGDVEVHQASALDIASICEPGTVDLILTSPPYIPASSGREHYARARAIPLVLTGAASIQELEEIDHRFVGEMSGTPSDLDETAQLPDSVSRTLRFLEQDDQRRPKHLPTLRYYLDMRRVLEQVGRVLSPEGVALFVVASSHTFYIHRTRQILHTVDSVRAIADLGRNVGLNPVQMIVVPLHKSGGLNARPRSTDEYSEAVVVFRSARTECGRTVRDPVKDQESRDLEGHAWACEYPED
jgi:DNA modification methylase